MSTADNQANLQSKAQVGASGAGLSDEVTQAVIDKLIVDISKLEDISLVFWCLHCTYKKMSIGIRDAEREAKLYMILKDKKIIELVPNSPHTVVLTRLGLRFLQVIAKKPEINIFSIYLPREVKILEFISKHANIEHIRSGIVLEVHEEEEIKHYLIEVQGKQYYKGHVNDSHSAFSVSPNFGISEYGKEYLNYIKAKLRNSNEAGAAAGADKPLVKPIGVQAITREELQRRQDEKLTNFSSELINTIKGGDDVAFIFAMKKAMQYIGEEPNSIELTKRLMKDIFEF